jgi:hypothetical protein
MKILLSQQPPYREALGLSFQTSTREDLALFGLTWKNSVGKDNGCKPQHHPPCEENHGQQDLPSSG